MRVLAVDDDPAMLEALGVVLRSAGYAVTLASSDAAALRLLDSAAFDVVITDLEMPGLSGVELVGRMRACPEYEEVPIVVVSGRVGMADLDNAQVQARVSKPFAIETLLATLRGVTQPAPRAAA